MICSSCSQVNPEKARFCLECGSALVARCGGCGAELPSGAKFCTECGAPVSRGAAATRPVEAAGARKIVSILFADLVGSTGLHERLDPESARRFMESYYAVAREAVEGHGGTVTQLLGDGVMAVFGIPRVAEDDAIRAVRAAVAMQERFRALADQQRNAVGDTGLRVALNTGEVVEKGATEIIGDPVNVAARLQERGRDGDVLIGEATLRLVAKEVSLELLGSFGLKGRAEPVKAYRVVSLDAPGRATATPFVGREDELARIAAVYDRAVETPATQLAVLLGSPGLGKSRLIAEFARRTGATTTVVAARCDAARGATFAPVADALRALLDVAAGASGDSMRAAVEKAVPDDDPERARLAAGIVGLLTGAPGLPEETFFVVRRFLAGLARTRPVVLVIDDLQWAEPLLLDLVEHLVQWGRELPLLVLIGARPELREVRSTLAMPGGLVADVLALDGLDAGAAMQLAAAVIGATDLPVAVAAKVLATSEGNPLFIGELVRMLVDEGALTRDGDRWTAGQALATVEMPPTIHVLLAARIERLAPAERAALECAAVVGRQFSRSSVAALLPGGGDGLDARLESLQRAELIERDTGWLLGEPVLRFHHVLIRDAAYRRLLKGTRAELHERLASWIEERVGDAPEHDETVGRHLEEAHRLLGELGPIDDAGRLLGERAATRLSSAGRRALEGDDVPLAAGLLGRALDRLRADDPRRADLLLDWCEALLAAGDVTRGGEAIAELGRLVRDSDRLRAWHTCFVGQHAVLTAPQELSSTVAGVAAAARSLASLDDAAGEAKAYYVHALALARLGRVGACETALDQALAAARRAGDRRQANTVLAIAPLAALWGPSPVTRASGRCLDVVRVLRITQGAPAVEAIALNCQGVLEALRGRTEAAQRMITSGRAMVEELGITQRLLEADVLAGLLSLLEGDAPAAERRLRGAYEGLRELGLGIDSARAAALLGRSCLAQGRIDEAEALSRASEALAGDDLKAAIAWRGVRAEALARRGEHAEAIALAQAAVAIAAATDALLDHADARLALAAALRAADRGAEADGEDRRAIELWEAKGATLLAERARRAASPAPPPVVASAPRVAPVPRRRPVRPNFAIEQARRTEAAVAARDVQALSEVYRPDVEIVDHQQGVAYGRDAIIERVRAVIEESTEGAFRHEALATLGDFVGLLRMHSAASASVVRGVPLGATELTSLLVLEADDKGCARRIDIFGEDAIADAVVRLYERHGALLPEGAARTRAAAAARSLAIVSALRPDFDRYATALSPEIEFRDHRKLGMRAGRGPEKLLHGLQAFDALTTDLATVVQDLLVASPDGAVVRCALRGLARATGGEFELPFLTVAMFDEVGRIGLWEWFGTDHEAEALSRFYALTAGAERQRPVRRRVRPNAASRMILGIEAGLADRDRSAIEALLGDPLLTVEHLTGATYGREGQLEAVERMLRLPDCEFKIELLATLGDALTLCRRRVSASGSAGGRFDVAEYEMEHVSLVEADARGRMCLSEVFGADHLGDAIVRLYERHAELMPEGPARERAATAARVVRMLALTPFGLDPGGSLVDPDVEFVDQRNLGSWNARGARELTQHLAALHDVARAPVVRTEDILALEPTALLVQRLHSGTERAGGGVYERQYHVLGVLGPDGRLTRVELFEVGDEARVLGRFDELIADRPDRDSARLPARRRVRANGATALLSHFEAVFASGDDAALAELWSDDLAVVDHPTGASYGRDGHLGSLRRLRRARDPSLRVEPLATLGEDLVLARRLVRASGTVGAAFDVAEWEREELVLFESKGNRRFRRLEIFALAHVGDAFVRLYERHAALLPEGAARIRAAAAARSLAIVSALRPDFDRWATAVSPEIEYRDRRKLGTAPGRGPAKLLRGLRAFSDLTTDLANTVQDVLVASPDGTVARSMFRGLDRATGGEFELPFLTVGLFDEGGRIGRWEWFDTDCDADALACFDELTAESSDRPAAQPPSRRAVRPNAATAALARIESVAAARDWAAARALLRDDYIEIDHPSRSSFGPDEAVASVERLFRSRDPYFRYDAIATLGAFLYVGWRRAGASGATGRRFDVGAYENAAIQIYEADERGLIRHSEAFAPDRLGAAMVRLYELYAESLPEGPGRNRAAAMARVFLAFDGPIDPDRIAAVADPASRSADHRVFGTWTASDLAESLLHYRHQLELAPDFAARFDDVLAIAPDAVLACMSFFGTARDSGGAFENRVLLLFTFGADGRVRDTETFEEEQWNEALARFDALAGRG